MMDDQNWGGKRSGSGRKKIDETIKKQGVTFQITKEELSFIESFGGKNRSDSLRNFIEEYKNLKKQLDFSSLMWYNLYYD